MLEASVNEPGQNSIELDGCTIKVNDELGHHPKGKAITLALRPEAVSLEARKSHDTSLDATIEDVHFLGSVIRTRVALGKNQLSFDTFNDPTQQPPQRGDKVTVHFAAHDLLVLAD